MTPLPAQLPAEWRTTVSIEHPDGFTVDVSARAPGSTSRRVCAELSEYAQMAASKVMDGYARAVESERPVAF